MGNFISRLFGVLASYRFPRWIQVQINHLYISIFKIDLSEFDSLGNYDCLNALFTRSLKKHRNLELDSRVLVCPTDSLVTSMGEVRGNMALQIKGMEYRVYDFLGSVVEDGYSYINFYLSPRDYHRYHAPCDMEIFEIRYFGGELLPVHRKSLLKNKNLFVRNERVVVCARDRRGEIMYFIAVGALNVGKMIFHFESRIQTNAHPNQRLIFSYCDPIRVTKGEELGMFMMGSTVVLFFKNIKFNLTLNQRVRYADGMATFSIH